MLNRLNICGCNDTMRAYPKIELWANLHPRHLAKTVKIRTAANLDAEVKVCNLIVYYFMAGTFFASRSGSSPSDKGTSHSE